MRPSTISHILVAAALLTASCRHQSDDEGESRRIPMHLSRGPGGGSARPLQPGDIRIASTDSGVDIALIGDTISGGLSQRSLAKVRSETDTGAVTGSGLGAEIERMVKGTVQSALATRVAFPLSEIRDVRYDGRRLVFEWNGKPQGFSHMNVNGKDVLATFSPADAQRFSEAVRLRKRALGRM